MKSWFTSLNGALTLSVIALVTELWRAFFDFQNVYPNYLQGPGMILLGTLIYTLLFAGWAWALMSAARGSRSGWIAALIINALFWLIVPFATLIAYCPSPCASVWPVAEIGNWIDLITGLLAATAVVVQLTRKTTAVTA